MEDRTRYSSSFTFSNYARRFNVAGSKEVNSPINGISEPHPLCLLQKLLRYMNAFSKTLDGTAFSRNIGRGRRFKALAYSANRRTLDVVNTREVCSALEREKKRRRGS